MTDTFTAGAATCPNCGTRYVKDQPWKRVCLSCYLHTKNKAGPTLHTLPSTAPIEPDSA